MPAITDWSSRTSAPIGRDDRADLVPGRVDVGVAAQRVGAEPGDDALLLVRRDQLAPGRARTGPRWPARPPAGVGRPRWGPAGATADGGTCRSGPGGRAAPRRCRSRRTGTCPMPRPGPVPCRPGRRPRPRTAPAATWRPPARAAGWSGGPGPVGGWCGLRARRSLPRPRRARRIDQARRASPHVSRRRRCGCPRPGPGAPGAPAAPGPARSPPGRGPCGPGRRRRRGG